MIEKLQSDSFKEYLNELVSIREKLDNEEKINMDIEDFQCICGVYHLYTWTHSDITILQKNIMDLLVKHKDRLLSTAFSNAGKEFNISFFVYKNTDSIYSSRDEYYRIGLFHHKLNPEAHYNLNYLSYKEHSTIENIDKYIVGPVYDALQKYDDWRILVAPDHPTPIKTRSHSADAVPFAMAGRNVSGILHTDFSEANAAKSGLKIEKGAELMEYFLKQ